MKQASDHFTADMFVKRPVGRPRKPDAKSVKQRVREHRARKAISVTCNGNSSPSCSLCSTGLSGAQCSGLCKVGQLGYL